MLSQPSSGLPVNKSRLQLNHYNVVRLRLEPADNQPALSLGQYADFSKANFRSKTSHGQVRLPNGEPRTTVVVRLEGEPQEGQAFPYSFLIELVGLFDGSDLPEEKREALVVANGASLLYGAARELLLTLSMRNMMGGLMLPSVSFESVGKEIEAKHASRAAQISGKATDALLTPTEN